MLFCNNFVINVRKVASFIFMDFKACVKSQFTRKREKNMLTVSGIKFNSNVNQKSNVATPNCSTKLHSQPMADTVSFGGYACAGIPFSPDKVPPSRCRNFFGMVFERVYDIYCSIDRYTYEESSKIIARIRQLANQNLLEYKPEQFNKYINKFMEVQQARTVIASNWRCSEFIELKFIKDVPNKIEINDKKICNESMRSHIIERFGKAETKETFVDEYGKEHTLSSYFDKNGIFEGIEITPILKGKNF